MTLIHRKVISMSLMGLWLFGCETLNSPVKPSKVEPNTSTYFETDAKPVKDQIYVGGQPTEIDFKSLEKKGIKHVVNFRTPKEMTSLNFDEAAILKSAGISYTPIPIGGDAHPYSPDTMSKLADVLETRNGPILLHCGSGYRASVITVAWLVEKEGVPLNDALEHAQGWWPLRLEEVLDTSFKLVEE